MNARLALFALLILGACGTPQERCVASVTRDLRVVNRLIAETETNLARGYALEEVTVFRPAWVDCSPGLLRLPQDGSNAVLPQQRLCLEDRPETITRPKAIDLDAERRILEGLQTQRATLERRSAPAIAQCRTEFPE